MTAGNELSEGELRLLAARQGAGVLECDVAHQAERAERAAPFGLGRERAVAQMIDHLRARDNSFVFLRVVADRDAGTEHHIAGVVRLEAGENAQERCFAGAVEAEYEQALAPLQSERKLRPDRPATERLREAVDLQGVATAVRRGREAAAHVRAARIGVTVSAASRPTRLSRVFACRARFALEWRIRSARVESRPIRRADGRRCVEVGPHPSPGR